MSETQDYSKAAEPIAHKTSHEDGGSDEVGVAGLSGLLADPQHVRTSEVKAVKLDDFAAPDDNTDLDSSTTKHGLLPKLSGVDSEFLNSQGGFSVPQLPKLLSYGVAWNQASSSPILTRYGTLAGFPSGFSPGNVKLPIHALIRRCILDDAGDVVYYLDASDSTQKELGGAANLDGSDGQVMVEIPKFYYKYDFSTNVHIWEISLSQLDGYILHPAFLKNGVEVDNRYIGAYEGVGFDFSAGDYIDHGNVAATGWSGTTIDTANDILSSVSGKNPITDQTRAELRSIAANRGTGWRQLDFYLVSAIQLLYLIEFAAWNSQSNIGPGRTELTGGTWVNGSYISEGGLSNGDGNGTNAVSYSGDADNAGAELAYMTYRGIENFFGNIWSWIDGFNINNRIPYVSNIDTDFDDDTTLNYTRLIDINGDGITFVLADGYQSKLEQTKGGFLPSAVLGSQTTYITDYFNQSAGWRSALLGGHATYDVRAGFFFWYLVFSSSSIDPSVGSRLSF